MTSGKILDLLRRYESRNVTFVERDGSWPIVWERARGVHVWDAEGRKYLDLTAAFGVAAAGHANPRIVQAGQKQMATLLHAMGDVHPHALKAKLARELSRLTFERWCRNARNSKLETRNPGKTIFCNSGFEAVEAALKTAMLATGRSGVIAFEGAYHGLGYGALNATHRAHFRGPFASQLREFGHFVHFPAGDSDLAGLEDSIRRQFKRRKIGAILVEPIQARGGINIPPVEFLPTLRRICDEHGALLILDEIYTGFGRTGAWFACEHSGIAPDLICLGKALTGGFPLSACVGRAHVMDAAWPESSGEAIHTSTFLGHPVGCAMALAQIAEVRRLELPGRSRRLGSLLLDELKILRAPRLDLRLRGAGLMAGLELLRPDGKPATGEALDVIKRMLRRGFILLPEGESSNVISFTPPLTITAAQLRQAVRALREELGEAHMTLSEMRRTVDERGLQLTKSLGQNFLHDGNQLRRIVAAAELQPTDRVLEIGPGLGPLTELLLAGAGEVFAIEKDERLVAFLRERFASEPKLRLLHGDGLEGVRAGQSDWAGWKLVANLPYSVASPILVELAMNAHPPERMVATLQLEVARRLMARAGDEDYGILSLLVQLRYEPRGLLRIPRGCFFPPPDVDSACITLVQRERELLPVALRPAFVRLVKLAFSQRRKMMAKLLKRDWPADRLEAAFAQLNLSPTIRAEAVRLEQFVELTRLMEA